MSAKVISHEEAWSLLPWLANGSLEGEELERVELHVRECLPCRAELREQRAIRQIVRRQPEVPLSVEQNFARLSARLDDAAQPEQRAHASSTRRRRPWAMLAAAAACIAVGVAAVLLTVRDPAVEPGSYTVLSDPPGELALVDIVFTEAATEADMRALVEALDGTIVGGPSRVGRYTVAVGTATLDEAELDALIRTLLADPRVRFAGRAFTPVDRADERSPLDTDPAAAARPTAGDDARARSTGAAEGGAR